MMRPIYHAGERAVQDAAGERAIADRHGAAIGDTIPAPVRAFIARQYMVALASVDAAGAPWASLLYGEPGFAHADTEALLAIDASAATRDGADPFWTNVLANPALGMLFIDLGSRRRYRVNGRLRRLDAAGFDAGVREAYGNCPRYIQRRRLLGMDGGFAPGLLGEGQELDDTARAIIARADTVFIASNHPRSGADASHRGGNAGFVALAEDALLRIPDYPGNSLFNTLGNLVLDPRAGLCIPDFDGGLLLQLSGQARILHGQDDAAGLSGGTGRFLEIEVAHWRLRRVPRRMEWEFVDASPFNPPGAMAT